MHNKITSLTNPHIKNVVELRDRRERDRKGLTIVEGQREVARALEARVPFKELYICPELLGDHRQERIWTPEKDFLNVPIFETTKNVFSKMAYGDRLEGILGICQPTQWPLWNLPEKRDALYVVVEAIEKPGNLGAILRTCDGVNVDGILICDDGADVYNPNVIRASLGTVFSLKVAVGKPQEIFDFFKTRQVQVYATQPEAKTIYTKSNLKQSVALVFGSESEGLSDFWVKRADQHIQIPMRGKADSLNVSSSAAILLYETLRQRSI